MRNIYGGGRFITVEGIEGAGKTSSVQYVKELLEAAGHEVVTTREPGGTKLGEEIRSLVLGHREEGMSETTELMLMFAARVEHMAKVIVPALDDGKWVLCDRFTDASYAYQGGGRGIPRSTIKALADVAHPGYSPDLTLLLDVPVKLGLARARTRGEPDRMESEKIEFFERVRQAYLDMASREPFRFRVIDASRSVEEVREQIAAAIKDWADDIAPK